MSEKNIIQQNENYFTYLSGYTKLTHKKPELYTYQIALKWLMILISRAFRFFKHIHDLGGNSGLPKLPN
jgi:hypothetical protein